jgi:hypothetical protein
MHGIVKKKKKWLPQIKFKQIGGWIGISLLPLVVKCYTRPSSVVAAAADEVRTCWVWCLDRCMSCLFSSMWKGGLYRPPHLLFVQSGRWGIITCTHFKDGSQAHGCCRRATKQALVGTASALVGNQLDGFRPQDHS